MFGCRFGCNWLACDVRASVSPSTDHCFVKWPLTALRPRWLRSQCCLYGLYSAAPRRYRKKMNLRRCLCVGRKTPLRKVVITATCAIRNHIVPPDAPRTFPLFFRDITLTFYIFQSYAWPGFSLRGCTFLHQKSDELFLSSPSLT